MTYKKLTIAAILVVAISLVIPTALAAPGDGNVLKALKASIDGILDRIDALEQNTNEITIEVAPAEIQIVTMDGLPGETGPQGIQGETGPAGKDGIDGEQGIRGEQGIQGESGDGEAFDGSADSITRGILNIDRLPVGTSSDEIASGDHIHSSLETTVISLESTVSTLEARILEIETSLTAIPFTMVIDKPIDEIFKEGDTLRISGTAEPESSIELEMIFPSWGSQKLPSPSVDVEGNWEYTNSMDDGAFEEGEYTINVTVFRDTLTDTFSYEHKQK